MCLILSDSKRRVCLLQGPEHGNVFGEGGDFDQSTD